ncbi:hypothetical protein ACIQC7_27685 [Kitasatospora sp. NPDC088556]|uniref:hypothetical protein n=1 Tax=Kitasatospora sp. NPDC088556 TaxID=3364076 RepID=UPI003820CE55
MSDGMLHARIDVMWMRVVLRDRGVRYDTLRTLAEAWGDSRQRVVEALDQLAAVVDQGGPAWDAAVDDVEADLQMDEAEATLTHVDAYRLSDELLAAAALTMSARSSPLRPGAGGHRVPAPAPRGGGVMMQTLILNGVEVFAVCQHPVEGAVILSEADLLLPDDAIGLPVCCGIAQDEFRAGVA